MSKVKVVWLFYQASATLCFHVGKNTAKPKSGFSKGKLADRMEAGGKKLSTCRSWRTYLSWESYRQLPLPGLALLLLRHDVQMMFQTEIFLHIKFQFQFQFYCNKVLVHLTQLLGDDWYKPSHN
jgi:hypothetical protein